MRVSLREIQKEDSMENLADCIQMWMIDYKKNGVYRICGALTHIAA